MNKNHSNLIYLRMNLCICIRKVGARIRAGGGSLYEGGGIGWNGKEESGNKNVKNERQTG